MKDQSTKQANPKWLSLKQTMEFLQCSKTSVYNIAKLYNIRQSKLSTLIYFSREDIERVLEQNAIAMGIAA
jgi:hypothetical protein